MKEYPRDQKIPWIIFFVFIQKISIIYYYSEYDDKILGRRGATLLPMFPFIFNTNERGY